MNVSQKVTDHTQKVSARLAAFRIAGSRDIKLLYCSIDIASQVLWNQPWVRTRAEQLAIRYTTGVLIISVSQEAKWAGTTLFFSEMLGGNQVQRRTSMVYSSRAA